MGAAGVPSTAGLEVAEERAGHVDATKHRRGHASLHLWGAGRSGDGAHVLWAPADGRALCSSAGDGQAFRPNHRSLVAHVRDARFTAGHAPHPLRCRTEAGAVGPVVDAFAPAGSGNDRAAPSTSARAPVGNHQ
jgi:hypothetical protein